MGCLRLTVVRGSYTVRSRRGILFAGFAARMREGRLTQRVMFRELVGGKRLILRIEVRRTWMGCLKSDLPKFGIKAEGWAEAPQKPASWFERVEREAGGSMLRWRGAKAQHGPRKAKARHRQPTPLRREGVVLRKRMLHLVAV